MCVCTDFLRSILQGYGQHNHHLFHHEKLLQGGYGQQGMDNSGFSWWKTKLKNGGGEKRDGGDWKEEEETEKLGRARKSRGEGGGEERQGGKMKIHSDKEQSKQKQTDLPVV